jgi:DNA invertase Pin-like site-specific DNA recombinase
MNAKRYVKYIRVSSKGQADNYSFEAQAQAVDRFLNGLPHPVESLQTFREVETGANDDRPQLKLAIDLAKAKNAIIVVSSIDRIGRSLPLLYLLEKSGVSFIAANNSTIDSFSCKILMLCAERERELIAQRVSAGLAIAKQKGVKLGNRRNPKEAWNIALKTIRQRKQSFESTALKSIEEIKSTGVSSYNRIALYLNRRGEKTIRGNAWNAMAVKRVLLSQRAG